MADEQDRLEMIYTYTYDQFTVFFYDDHVFIFRFLSMMLLLTTHRTTSRS